MRRRYQLVRPFHVIPVIAAVIVTLVLPELAAAQRDEQTPIAEEQLVGTTLTVVPQMLYTRAVLRVTGPDAYALTKRFGDGAPIAVDLLTAGQGSARSWLPDGIYSYEVVFMDLDANRSMYSGEFRVINGNLAAVTPKSIQIQPGSAEELQAAPAGASATRTPERLEDPQDIVAGSGLAAGSTTANPTDGEIELHFDETRKAVQAFASTLVLEPIDSGFSKALSVHVDGGVGLGTTVPQADIDIRDMNQNANAAFRLTTDNGAWAAAVGPAGNMVFSKVDPDTGAAEFFFRERNHPDSTMEVRGHVRGTSFKSSSSAALKTAFEEIDPQEVLGQLDALAVTAWRYKTDAERTRHIGPTAEDFQRLLGLGDGKTIASVDAEGVLFAAVQALKQMSDEREAAVQKILAANEAEIAALRAELEALKSKVADR